MIPEIPEAVLVILKIFFLVGLLLYGVFAIVLVRQEQLMAHVLEEAFEQIIRLLVMIHAVGALVLFILALILL